MGRFLAIDYGKKRIGIAVSDTDKIIATKLGTIDNEKIFSFLKNYLKENEVELFVVGNPKQMNNQPSEVADEVNGFTDKLKESFPDKDIYLIDERYTSKMASQTIARSNLKKKDRRDKGLIDSVAAVMILQDFMQMYKNNTNNIKKKE